MLLRESVFLKSECKSTNYFSFHQIFGEKSFKNRHYLTVLNTFMPQIAYFRPKSPFLSHLGV